MRNLYAICHKNDGHVELFGQNVITFSSDDISFEILGRVFCDDNKINDCEKIALLYKEYGVNITEHIHGNYIIIFKNHTENTLAVIHDSVTSPFAVYYTEDSENIYISTSIKTIYTYCKAPRSLNEYVIDDFLLNGIINSNETLIDGLYKLCYSQALVVSDGKYAIEYVKYPSTTMTEDEGKAVFNEILLDSVGRCALDTEPLNIALSSGYDSNYILYALREKTSAPINAFSIGGIKGNNELPYARQISKLYDNINYQETLIDSNDLQNMPDIVWRLEGAMNEEGLFLQYALSSTLSSYGVNTLICGESADQIFNQRFHTKDERLKRLGVHGIKYSSTYFPFEIGILAILKKSGIMANSFGIDTRYPFVDDRVIDVADATKELNGFTKEYQKQNCKEHFKNEVYEIVNHQKISGKTSYSALFADDDELISFYKLIEKSKWHSKTEKNLFTRINWKLRCAVIKRMSYKNNDEVTEKTLYDEIKMKRYQNLLYLLIFEKLFISGQFDTHFNESGINVKLKDLF